MSITSLFTFIGMFVVLIALFIYLPKHIFGILILALVGVNLYLKDRMDPEFVSLVGGPESYNETIHGMSVIMALFAIGLIAFHYLGKHGNNEK